MPEVHLTWLRVKFCLISNRIICAISIELNLLHQLSTTPGTEHYTEHYTRTYYGQI